MKSVTAAGVDRLYAGKANEIIAELCQRRHAIAVTGPGNKGKRERLLSVIGYLQNRVHQMPYDQIIKQDLELGSGAVEGAVKNIIGKRCDHGGIRWIEERVEAVVQLRCIEANGDWDRFAELVAVERERRLLADAHSWFAAGLMSTAR